MAAQATRKPGVLMQHTHTGQSRDRRLLPIRCRRLRLNPLWRSGQFHPLFLFSSDPPSPPYLQTGSTLTLTLATSY